MICVVKICKSADSYFLSNQMPESSHQIVFTVLNCSFTKWIPTKLIETIHSYPMSPIKLVGLPKLSLSFRKWDDSKTD